VATIEKKLQSFQGHPGTGRDGSGKTPNQLSPDFSACGILVLMIIGTVIGLREYFLFPVQCCGQSANSRSPGINCVAGRVGILSLLRRTHLRGI